MSLRSNGRRVPIAMLIAGLSWVCTASGQQTPSKRPGPVPGQTIITDAAGRVHIRNPRITDTQRKDVAKRMQTARVKKAAGKKNPGDRRNDDE